MVRFTDFVYSCLYYLHRLFEKSLIIVIKTCIPVNKTVVIFKSMPDFSDNARALAEFMVENGYTKKYSIFFDVEENERFKKRKDNIAFISTTSKYGKFKIRSIYRLYTAGYLMSTHKPIIAKRYARKDQNVINLWHGCSFKDRSAQDGKGTAFFDYALVAGNLFVKTKAYFWNVDEKRILPLGFPRYDWLIKKDETAQILIDRYKKNTDDKVILWMPTFRIDKRGRCTETNSITQFPLVGSIDQWNELDELCINNNINLIVKLHPFQTEYGIPFDSFSNIAIINNRSFEQCDVPMYKFVALTDGLISDYSSIAIDYLIVNRPIAFTLDDFEEYRNKRGFVFDDPRIYMPGHHLYKFDDLKCFLLNISAGIDPYKIDRKKMYGKAICQSEHYCKDILDRFSIKIDYA